MGTLYIVATPIGNLKDISARAIETLKEVDLILCEDTRTTLKLLNHFEIRNKLASYHKFNEQAKTKEIINLLKNNTNIALVSDAGTPCISDPGYILVKSAKEEGVKVIGVGGISALITALSISGLNTETFTFHGFFPRETKEKKEKIKEMKSSETKVHIFYESPKRITKTLELINENMPNIKISISKELTKLHEKNYYGNIHTVLEKIKQDEKTSLGEYTFIIEKEEKQKKEKENIAIEALLINEMIEKNITLKEAIESLSEKTDLSKKEIYKKSLNLKNIIT